MEKHTLGVLMGKTEVAALNGKLPAGKTTVGSGLVVTHLATTPEGMEVKGFAKVVEAEGRKVIFEVEAEDEKERIAEGTHTRFIVDEAKFQDRAESKLATE